MSRIPVRAALMLALVGLVAWASLGLALAPNHHHMVRFWLDTDADRAWMAENHLQFQIEAGRKDSHFDILVEPADLDYVLASGSRAELLHEDAEAFYASRLGAGAGDRDLWGYYHTYSEAIAWVDSLRLLYPAVVSEKWPLGQGHDGYSLFAFRLSDNPDVDEPDEPEALFDGLHHANEIMGLEVAMMVAEYLAQLYYAGDPEIVELVDSREIYFVPFVNPDGLVYNELTYPGGGASWRKNRRNNGGGSWGVDLNRNYDYEWGCDWGSSGDPNSVTYRGPAAASEPEVQALSAFIDSREFVVHQSYHSSGLLTLYPWGYTTDDTPDEAIYREMGAAMTMYNGYTAGQPGDVLYDVCGGTFDWSYGATQDHEKVFCFSNELGTSQWPPQNQRQVIFDNNLWPALYLIQMAGELRAVSWAHQPLPFTGDLSLPYELGAVPTGYEGAAIDPSSVTMHYRVDGGGFVDQLMTPTGNPGEYGGSIPAQPLGSVVEYYLSASDVEGHTGTSPRGAPDALHYFEVGGEFVHPMEADRGWTAGDPADDAGTGLWVRVDPVGTDAQPEDDHTPNGTHCWVTGQHTPGQSIGFNDVDGGKTTLFSPVYDMTEAQSVAFAYWRWYSNDQGSAPGEDFWDVFLSNDAGQNWTALEHTQVSSNAWETLSFDLADFFAEPGLVQLKFVASDEGSGSIVEAAVDDFSIAGVFDATGSGESPAALALAMEQNYPNPFNPKTTIRFRLPEAGPVSLGVYDARGRIVRQLEEGRLPAGEHATTWNGRDALGRPVASGVYFARLRTAAGELDQRMVLLK